MLTPIPCILYVIVAYLLGIDCYGSTTSKIVLMFNQTRHRENKWRSGGVAPRIFNLSTK